MTTTAGAVAAINAAMDVAADVAEGRLAPAQLTAEAVEACRELVGTVAGAEDPLWPVQLDITRQVLAAGGIPAGELAEWVAVMRTRGPVTPVVHDGGMSGDGVQAMVIDEPRAEVTVYPPGAPLPPGSVVDVGTEAWSDEPMHTLSDDCPCGPTVVSMPGHHERQHGDIPADDA